MVGMISISLIGIIHGHSTACIKKKTFTPAINEGHIGCDADGRMAIFKHPCRHVYAGSTGSAGQARHSRFLLDDESGREQNNDSCLTGRGSALK
ncbi:hypothetical protein DFP73DRAFT_381905 [Morchella snyderi]|nr:hypothetical protein DFP73DRAFT_381905 [Morchella snyderi]